MFKISLPNYDVKDSSPEQLAVDSNYDTLKTIVTNDNPYFGEILVTFRTNPPAGTYTVFTYKHGFDYTPLYYVYLDLFKSSKTLGGNPPFDTATQFGNDVLFDQQFKVVPIEGGFKLDYINGGVLGGDISNNYFSFRYFVYVNDGV